MICRSTREFRSYRKGITLMDAVKKFDTEEKAETWFLEQRWPSGRTGRRAKSPLAHV